MMKKLIMTAHSMFFHILVSVPVLVDTSNSSTWYLKYVSVKSGISAALAKSISMSVVYIKCTCICVHSVSTHLPYVYT